MKTVRTSILSLVALFALVPQLVSAAPGQRVTTAFAQMRILATGNDGNVYLMDGNGKILRQLTSRTSQTLRYPWYSWSPDHRYALLARKSADSSQNAVLLLDGTGALLPSPFSKQKMSASARYPSWAGDADVIAYATKDIPMIDKANPYATAYKVTVVVTGVNGSLRGTLPTYEEEDASGCGGGPPPATFEANAAEWSGHDASNVQWSIHGRRVVTQSDACGTSLPQRMLDRVTGHVLQVYWPRSNARQAEDVQLAPSGSLYAVEYAGESSSQPPLITIYNDQDQKIVSAPGGVPAWSPNSRYVYFSDCQSGNCALYDIDLRTKKQGRISPWESAYAFGPLQIAPDSSTLFFSRIEAVGSNQARVTIQRFDGTGFTTISTSASRPAI